MCGIAGILSEDMETKREILENMTSNLAHRGPDGAHTVLLTGCGFGHRRLSIIDLETGDQPMFDISGRYLITFNGEIYNYRELKKELEERGATFQTRSDTEVILQAYIAFGERAPERLNGQFAFVIWDTYEKVAFAARDRLGEKPLYWAETSRHDWLFASEIKSILASGLITPVLDLQSVDAYLALLYMPPNRTIYKNIHTLQPAHALIWKNGQIRQWRYWEPRFSTETRISWQDAVEQTRRLIAQAVKRQMVADVPVGAFLSGGLDSSTVVALMSKYTDQPIKTFSVGFGDLINELPYARQVSQQYQTEHHEINMDIPVGDMLELMAEVYDEPLGDSSNIPTYLISKFTRQFVKVVLSGDGGDELFGGYDWYRFLILSEDARQNSRFQVEANLFLWRALSKLNRTFVNRADQAFLIRRLAKAGRTFPEIWQRHLALHTSIYKPRRRWWGMHLPATEDALKSYISQETQGLDRVVQFDALCYLPGDILVKVDRAALAHGLESRAPFLDVDLVEFVWSLPTSLRFRDGSLKPLLKESANELWPDGLRNRDKQGFGAPIWNWISRSDVSTLIKRVTSHNSPLCGLLPGIPEALAGLTAQQTWTLLCLGLWLEKHSYIIED